MSIPNDLSTFEKVNNMKNMLGGSFIEFLKPNIKTKQNESVLKMLELAKDKPEQYLELLAVAIFHQNFEIIKYMVEKFKIMETNTPYMKASSFFNSIIPDDSKDKINDSKDYNEIQIPFVIMSGIGGDIEIFKYLLKNQLISNKGQNGIIGLSKKFKNTFTSNILGACAYYGKSELLEYLLKHYRNEFDINITTNEKKAKNTKFGFTKEYSGCTPCLLAMVGPSSDSKTLEILKIFNNFGAHLDVNDFNKDNLLHLATKNKKIETAKYIIDELKLKNLVNETNKDGYTPLSLAQHLNEDIFISYYSEKNEIDEKEIEENLKELIQDSARRSAKQNKKSKKKKKKDKNNNIPTLLNASEFQETLKVEKKEEESNKNESNELQDEEKKNENQENNENNENKENIEYINEEKKDEEEIKEESKEETIEKEKEKEESKENEEIKEKEEPKENEEIKEKEIISEKKESKKDKKNKKIEKVEKVEKTEKAQPSEKSQIVEQVEIIGLGTKKNKKNKKLKGLNKIKIEGENNENLNKEKEKEDQKEEIGE